MILKALRVLVRLADRKKNVESFLLRRPERPPFSIFYPLSDLLPAPFTQIRNETTRIRRQRRRPLLIGAMKVADAVDNGTLKVRNATAMATGESQDARFLSR